MPKLKTFPWGARTVAYSVDISPDGRWLAAGAVFEGAVCVWDLATDEIVAELTAIADEVDLGTEVRFSPDGDELVARLGSGSSNPQTELAIAPGTWRATKRSTARGCFLPVRGPNGLECICCKPSRASRWQVLGEIFDAEARKSIVKVNTPEDANRVRESVSSVAWLPDGTLAVAHSTSLGVGLYDPRTGALLRRLEDAPNKRRYRGNDWVAVAPSGQTIATTRQDDRNARVWRIADNELLHELSGHAKSHHDANPFHQLRCCFGPDGASLAVNAGQKKRGGAVTLHALCELRAPAAERAAASDDPEDREAEAIDALVEQTVQGLSSLSQITARTVDPILSNYLKRGSKLHCSPAMLRDYFSISSPTMPERAGLTAKQASVAEARYDVLSRKLFERSS